MNKYIRDLTEGDLEYLADNLRDADREEVLVDSLDVLEALQESVTLSYFVKAIDVSGVPCGILGLSEYSQDMDIVWLLGTPELVNHKTKFLRQSKKMVRELFELSGKSALGNYTYIDNSLHHKWLRYCGAYVSSYPVRVGRDRKEFLPFIMNRERYV